MKITKNRLRQIILEEVTRYTKTNITEVASPLHDTEYFTKALKDYLDMADAQPGKYPTKKAWNYNNGVYFWFDEVGSPNSSLRKGDLPDWAKEDPRTRHNLPVPRPQQDVEDLGVKDDNTSSASEGPQAPRPKKQKSLVKTLSDDMLRNAWGKYKKHGRPDKASYDGPKWKEEEMTILKDVELKIDLDKAHELGNTEGYEPPKSPFLYDIPGLQEKIIHGVISRLRKRRR